MCMLTNLDELIDEYVIPRKTGLFVCGPKSMIDVVEKNALKNNIDYHTEVFYF
jgi:hypothetical protein